MKNLPLKKGGGPLAVEGFTTRGTAELWRVDALQVRTGGVKMFLAKPGVSRPSSFHGGGGTA